jgi:hypothetical protein
VLASLDRIPGVRSTRVHHDGVYFLLALEPEADVADVLERAKEYLPDAERPAAKVESTLVEGFGHGETWLRSSDTKELSREEAHILAKRHADQAAAALGIDEGKKAKLLRVIDEETAAAFDRIHAKGGGLDSGSHREFEAAAKNVVERSRSFLDEAECSRLAEFLNGLLGG